MSESLPADQQSRPTPSPQAPVPRRRRRWPWVFLAATLLAILLLAVLPAIISMGWVRVLVVSQVNGQLNGQLQIDDWSFGWFSPTRIRGIRILQDGATILEAEELATDLNFMKVLTGRMFRLDQTTVSDLAFVFIRYPDGSNNFARLPRVPSDPNAPWPRIPAGLSVRFAGDVRGTIEQRLPDGTSQVAYLDKSTIAVSFADINEKIAARVNLAIRDPEGKSGGVAVESNVRLFDQGLPALDKLDGDASVTITSLDLGVAGAFMPPDAGIDRIDGQVNGRFVLKVAGSDSVVAEGAMTIADFSAAGPALGDDVYGNPKVTLAVPPTTLSRGASPRVRIGGSQDEKLTFTLEKHGTVAVSADAPLNALANLAANKAPGDSGGVGIDAQFDLAALAGELPHTLKLRDGLKVTGGSLKSRIAIALASDKATLKQDTLISGLTGELDGKAVAAQPITLMMSAEHFGGAGAMPDLRKIVMAVDSAFATVKGGGESLFLIRLEGNVRLTEFAAQFGQFVDLEQLGIASLAGDAAFSLATATDPNTPAGPTSLDAKLTTSKLTIGRVNPGGATLPLLTGYDSTLTLSATLAADAATRVLNITALSMTDSTGMLAISKDPATPFTIRMPSKGAPSATGRLSIKGNLVAIGDFLAGLRGPTALPPVAKITAGSLAAAIDLSRTESGTNLALDSNITGLSVKLPGQPIQNESVQLKLSAGGDDTLKVISVSSLILASSFVNANLDQPITIRLGAGGSVDASGAITVKGQLKQLFALVEALQLAAPDSLVNYGGGFVVSQKFSTNASQLVAEGQIVVSDFVVGDPARPSFREALLKIANNVRLDQSGKILDIQDVSVDMSQTKAATVSLAGKIRQYDTQGVFEGLVVTLGFDLAAAYKAILPMLQAGAATPDQRKLYEDIVVAGVRRDLRIPVTGRYPMNDPAAIKYVVAQAVVGFDRIEYQGIDIRKCDLPVSLADGRLRTIYADRQGDARFAKPARANDGTIDLSGWEISLVDRPMRLTCLREDYTLLNKVNIQEKSLAHFLGSISPIFYGTSKAKGFMSVTVNQVRDLPLDASITQSRSDARGLARVAFSISDMGIKAPFIDLLASQLGLDTQDGMVPMQLRDGAAAFNDGVVDSTMKLEIGGQTITADKAVISLADKKILAMYMGIPKTMLPEVLRQDFVKDTVVVPVAGTMSSPSFSIKEAIAKSFDASSVVSSVLGGKQGKAADAVGNLLGGKLPGLSLPGQKAAQAPKAQPAAKPQAAPKAQTEVKQPQPNPVTRPAPAVKQAAPKVEPRIPEPDVKQPATKPDPKATAPESRRPAPRAATQPAARQTTPAIDPRAASPVTRPAATRPAGARIPTGATTQPATQPRVRPVPNP